MSFGKFLGDSTTEKKFTDPLPSAVQASARGSQETVIGLGSKIVGRINFKDSAELHSEVEGDITSQSRLVIGEQAKIKGTIDGSEVIIQGHVEGEVRANKRLVLKKPCKFKGNIYTPSLSIEEGVAFEGSCIMPKDSATNTAQDNNGTTIKTAQSALKAQLVGPKQTGVAA